MATQKFMGKGQLLERLTSQIGDRKMAIEILQEERSFNSRWKGIY
jgi:hypothetical protein